MNLLVGVSCCYGMCWGEKKDDNDGNNDDDENELACWCLVL